MNENFKDETVMSMVERTIRRLWILCLTLIALLVVTNVSWICYENQFETVETTTTIDAEQETADGGNNTIVGGDYGTTESEDNTNN